MEKSTISFSPCMRLEVKAVIKDILGLRSFGNMGMYLGASTIVGRSTKEVFEWVKQKVWSKVVSWKERFLSKAGKEVMIKSVLQSLPVYTMGVFRVPQGVCDSIMSLLMRFWWSNKVHGRSVYWRAWSDLCKPKSHGGLGFKDIKDFNTALLAKQGWRLIQFPDSLMGRILQAKYFPHSNFFEAKMGRNSSYTWRSILSARHLLIEGGRWRVGDGRNISFWDHSWVTCRDEGRFYGPRMEEGQRLKVSDFINHNGRIWREDRLREILGDADVLDVLKIRLQSHPQEDKFCWPHEQFGEYTVKSGYQMLRHIKEELKDETMLWKVLWKMKVPPKIRHFAWRVMKHILPTRRSLFVRNISSNDQCPVCSMATETIDHAFVDCTWLASLWATVDLFPVPSLINGGDKILQWLRALAENHKYEDLTLGVVLLWFIWGSRNAYVFNGATCQAASLFQKAKTYLNQYVQNRPCSPQQHSISSAKWGPPDNGIFKVNYDGCLKGDGKAGVGAVIRDFEGAVLGAMSKPCAWVMSAKEVECLAIKDAMEFARDGGFRRIVIESDAAGVIAEINREAHSYSLHGNIIEDVKLLALHFDLCSFTFSPRSCNKVADRLACIGAYSEQERLWLEEIPDCIADVIIEDV